MHPHLAKGHPARPLWRLAALGLALLLAAACGQKSPDAPAAEALAMPQGYPAIDDLTARLRQSPDDATLYAQRAGILYEEDFLDLAAADLARAIALDSSRADYWHVLADVYLDKGEDSQAVATLQNWIERHPESLPSLLKLAELYWLIGDYQAGLRTCERLDALSPDNPFTHYLRGINLKGLGAYEAAETALRRTTALAPQDADAYYQLGLMLGERDDARALHYLDSALLLQPQNVDVLFAKGSFFQNQGRYEEAIALYRQVTLLDPQFVDALLNTGLAYLEMERPTEALAVLDIAVKSAPALAEAYFYRGLAKQAAGQNAAAEADFAQAQQLDPSLMDEMDTPAQ